MSAPNAGRFVGQSVKRVEDPRFLTGRGAYVDDVVVPGMLHAAFVRSDVARGVITRVDVDAARALDGVHAVYTAADLAPLMHPAWSTLAGPPGPGFPATRGLALDDVRYVGEPIAIVLARSRYVAEDACDLVEVDVDPSPAILDLDVARSTDQRVHAELASNVAATIPADGDVDAIFADAPHVVTRTFVQHRHLAVPMEGRGLVARFDAPLGALDVWLSTQGPHSARDQFARLLDLPSSKVRVVMGDVGGAFGQKMFVGREESVVVLASRASGRPVKWIEDRRENLVAASSSRAERIEVGAAVDGDGRILALRGLHVEDVGAYPMGSGAGTGRLVRMMLPGPYRIPAMAVASEAVFTNTAGRGPYRGPWMMETVAREQLVDAIARELGLDPVEVRRRNLVQDADLPYTSASGMVYDVVTPAETMEQALAMVDYEAFRAEQVAARADGRYLGVGISVYVEPSGMGRSVLGTEGATVRIQPDGRVHLVLGSAGHGHSLETTMAQVVAEHLGCEVEDVRVIQGDTAVTPYGGGTGGSRSAILYGSASREAAVELREKVVQIAAHLMEAAPEDLEVERSVVSVRGTPTRSVTLAEVAHAAYVGHDSLPPGVEAGLETAARFKSPTAFTWSNACHVCTCEVDVTTGLVRILRYVVSEDCGPMINPMVVEGQIAGGVVQGIGGVLLEHMVYDDDGNPLTTTFMDYLLPTAADVPTIEYGHVETRAATNPSGFKGMGEGGAIGSPPAVVNAVADALAPLGVRIERQPLGPADIVALVEAAAQV